MMKIFLAILVTILLLIIIVPETSLAAEGDLLWVKTGGVDTRIAYDVAVDATGIYVVGYDYKYVDPFGDTLWRIEKRNLTDGSLIWAQTSNPSSSSYYDTAYGVAVDATGIYVVGYGLTGSAGTLWRIEKRNLTDGSLIWVKTKNIKGTPYGVTIDTTGIYVVGEDFSPGNGQWRIEKRNLTDGSLIWEKTNNPSGGDDIAFDVTIDTTGIYVVGVVGFWWAPSNCLWRIEKRNLTDGSLIWEKTNSSTGQDIPYGVAVNATGIYVAGTDYAPGNGQWRIEKRNLTDGSLIWVKTSNPSGGYDIAYDVAVGTTSIYVAGDQNEQWRIEKRNLTDGSLIWEKTSNPDSMAYGVTIDATGIYAVGFVSYVEHWRIEKRSIICTGPISISWTDPIITANSTKIRKIHIDELRYWINDRRQDAGLSAFNWTDLTIVANSTKIRAIHFNEMRQAISEVYTACNQPTLSWTDSALTPNVTKIRKIHIEELRNAVTNAP